MEIIDVERNVSCRMKRYPELISGGTGGLIIFNGSFTPVLCGGLHSKLFTTDRTRCYVWKGQEWVEGGDTYRGGHLKTGGPPTSVVLDEQFLWLVGGFGHPSNPDPKWPWEDTFLFDPRRSSRDLILGPSLGPTHGMSGACAAVINRIDDMFVIAVLGGGVGGGGTDMTIFSCAAMSGSVPTFKSFVKTGPRMHQRRRKFGCGTIEAEDGSSVLIATKSGKANMMETLELTSELWNSKLPKENSWPPFKQKWQSRKFKMFIFE